MNRTVWYVLIGSLVLLLSGITGYLLLRDTEDLPATVPQVSGPEITPEDRQFTLDIENRRKELLEEKAKKTSQRNILEKAVREGNAELCSSIEVEEMKIDCNDTILYNEAISKNDLKYCEGLSVERQTKCRDNIIFTTAMRDISAGKTEVFCDTISDNTLKNNCIAKSEEIQLEATQEDNAVVTQTDCDRLTTSEVKNRCNAQVANQNNYLLYSQAIETGDEKMCRKITETALQEKCSDNLYYVLARKNTDILLCEKIQDVSLQSQCQKDLTALGESAKFSKAISTNNESLCEKIEDDSLERTCLDRIRIQSIINSKDATQCNILFDSSLRESCTKSIELASQL